MCSSNPTTGSSGRATPHLCFFALVLFLVHYSIFHGGPCDANTCFRAPRPRVRKVPGWNSSWIGSRAQISMTTEARELLEEVGTSHLENMLEGAGEGWADSGSHRRKMPSVPSDGYCVILVSIPSWAHCSCKSLKVKISCFSSQP